MEKVEQGKYGSQVNISIPLIEGRKVHIIMQQRTDEQGDAWESIVSCEKC